MSQTSDRSVLPPNRINLRNGGYILFDYFHDQYRIAVYTRKVSKGTTLEQALSRAIDDPPWSTKFKEIKDYIRSVNKYEGMTLD